MSSDLLPAAGQILVVCAVEAERAAILAAGCRARVIVAGVGPAAAAAAAAASADGARLLLSAGVGGGFAPLAGGDIAVASRVVFADLGAETGQGFRDLDFGTERYQVEPSLAQSLAERTGGRVGSVLTVATVTGTAETAHALLARHPDAVAEGMEGVGVAAAARWHGTGFGELRAISNAVGPRERENWQLPLALACLGRAVASIAS